MSAKSMFYRLFRIPQAPAEDATQWLVEQNDGRTYATPDGDAASIPLAMRPADPGEIDQMTDTTVIPAAKDDLHNDIVAYSIERAYNDVDATCKASTALRMGNLQAAVEGLKRYVALHPSEYEMPVAA